MQRSDWRFYGLAIGLGLLTAAHDVTAPWGDDTAKVSLLLWLGSAATLGVCRPGHAWRWALLIGPWLPLVHLVRHWMGLPAVMKPDTTLATALLLLVSIVAGLIGAYVGVFIRRTLFAAPADAA